MPELRIQSDHDSLSVLENAIQDYNFNTALRAVPPGILALAVLSWLNPMIPVAIAIVAAFATGTWLGIDGHPAVSQHASPTLPAPLLPPPPPSSGQGPPSARGPPSDHGPPYNPNYPSDQNPPYDHLRPTPRSPPPLSASEAGFQSAPESPPPRSHGSRPCPHWHCQRYHQQARLRHGRRDNDAWDE